MEELLQANIHQQVEVITNLRTQILNIKKRLAKLIPIEDFEEIRALEKQLEVIENERNKVIKAVLADSMRNLEGQDRFENSFTVLNKVFHAIDTSNPTDATLSLIRKNLNALSEFNPGKFQTVSFDYLRSHYRKKGITNSKDIEQLIRSPKVDPADSFTFAAAIKRVLERLHQKGQLTSEPVTMAN